MLEWSLQDIQYVYQYVAQNVLNSQSSITQYLRAANAKMADCVVNKLI